MDISKRVFGSNISEKVKNHLKKLQGETIQQLPNESVQESVDYSYIGGKTPYVRMWTGVNVFEVKRETVDGKRTYKRQSSGVNTFYVINQNQDDGYAGSELSSVGDGVKGNNPFLKPDAGIKSVNSKSEGALGALRRTTVEFVVHNKEDFEQIYLPFFLKPGSTVFLDFGWSESSTNFSLYDPTSQAFADEYANDIYLRKFFEEVVQKNSDTIEGGLSQTIAGNVQKYDVNVDAQGAFNCSIEIVSGNYRLLDKSVTDDNDLQFVFDNSLEELILGYLAAASGVKMGLGDLVNYRNSTNLTEDDKKNTVMNVLDRITNTPKIPGDVTELAKKYGIFYQDSTKQSSEVIETVKTRTGKEAIYISFGFFEDKFLNSFISEWITKDKEGNEIKRESAILPFSPSFSSQNTFIRWDENLFKMQKAEYLLDDRLISYLYPNTWNEDETYNGIIAKRTPTIGKVEDGKRTDIDKKAKRMPLRELFISVSTISEAFRTSSNVNDALEFIFDKIFEDSGTLLNIKMISPNDSQSSITFHDINLDAGSFDDQRDEIFEFDLTSGNSLVQNFDLKFETPKAGLSSMIAIGNLEAPEVFDTNELMKFHALNAIQGQRGRKQQIRHLPIFDDRPKRRGALTLKLEQLYSSAKNLPELPKFLTDAEYKSYKSERQKLEEDRAAEAEGNIVEPQSNEEDFPNETEDGIPIVYAKSDRDRYLLLSKIDNFIKVGGRSISPVLPVTLSLKLYGNNFLSYGDFFNINYLPEHYKERVVFQIVGVDHTIDTNGWSTNYTTVMRLKPEFKHKQSVNDMGDYDIPLIKYHGKLQKIKVDDVFASLPSAAQNSVLKHFAVDVSPGYERTFEVTEVEDFKKVGDIEIPNMTIEEQIFTVDVQGKLKEIEKEKGKQFMGGKKDEKIKFPMGINLPDSMANSGATSYWGNISSLILGDDLIDWALVVQDYQNLIDGKDFKPYLTNYDPKLLGKQYGDALGISPANQVYVVPSKDPNEYRIFDQRFDKFNDFVIEKLYERLGLSGKQGDKIYGEIFNKALLNLQKRSPILRYKDTQNQTRFNANDNFHIFKSLFWYIPQDQVTFWSVFKISGHSDYDVLKHVVVPKKYLKTNLDSTFTKLYRNYITIKNNYSKYFEGAYSSRTEAFNASLYQRR